MTVRLACGRICRAMWNPICTRRGDRHAANIYQHGQIRLQVYRTPWNGYGVDAWRHSQNIVGVNAKTEPSV